MKTECVCVYILDNLAVYKKNATRQVQIQGAYPRETTQQKKRTKTKQNKNFLQAPSGKKNKQTTT